MSGHRPGRDITSTIQAAVKRRRLSPCSSMRSASRVEANAVRRRAGEELQRASKETQHLIRPARCSNSSLRARSFPVEQRLLLAKARAGYDPEKLHDASGTG